MRDLTVRFRTEEGSFTAVDRVNLVARHGETIALVGESGCGKSVTSLAIMGLLPPPPQVQVGGEVRFRDQDLLRVPASSMRAIRGRGISMIFQEPMTSLNPVYRVGEQIVEGLRRRGELSAVTGRARAIELLQLVSIPAPESRVDAYPHELSGGMRQRVMIAMALAGDPALLIADEPTTALDVTIQAQILDLIRDLQRRLGTAVLLITHDLGVVAETADHVMVMYAGQIVEEAPVEMLFNDPQHPYTLGLMASIPRLDEERSRLSTIEGSVPHPFHLPRGCRFSARCPLADERCRAEEQMLRDLAPRHSVRCWKAPIEGIGG